MFSNVWRLLKSDRFGMEICRAYIVIGWNVCKLKSDRFGMEMNVIN